MADVIIFKKSIVKENDATDEGERVRREMFEAVGWGEEGNVGIAGKIRNRLEINKDFLVVKFKCYRDGRKRRWEKKKIPKRKRTKKKC